MTSFWFHLALYPAAAAVLIALMAAHDAMQNRAGRNCPCRAGRTETA